MNYFSVQQLQTFLSKYPPEIIKKLILTTEECEKLDLVIEHQDEYGMLYYPNNTCKIVLMGYVKLNDVFTSEIFKWEKFIVTEISEDGKEIWVEKYE